MLLAINCTEFQTKCPWCWKPVWIHVHSTIRWYLKRKHRQLDCIRKKRRQKDKLHDCLMQHFKVNLKFLKCRMHIVIRYVYILFFLHGENMVIYMTKLIFITYLVETASILRTLPSIFPRKKYKKEGSSRHLPRAIIDYDNTFTFLKVSQLRLRLICYRKKVFIYRFSK